MMHKITIKELYEICYSYGWHSQYDYNGIAVLTNTKNTIAICNEWIRFLVGELWTYVAKNESLLFDKDDGILLINNYIAIKLK